MKSTTTLIDTTKENEQIDKQIRVLKKFTALLQSQKKEVEKGLLAFLSKKRKDQ